MLQNPIQLLPNQQVLQQPDPVPLQDNLDFLLEGTFDTGDDQELWREVCNFFLHPLGHLEENQGKKLFGTKFALRPHQMEAVYVFLRQSFGLPNEDVGRYHGGINASGTGLGKTVIALGVIAVIRICELYAEPGAHTPVANFNNNTVCPDNNPFGILCPCISGSLGNKIMRAVVDQAAPTVMFVHRDTVYQIVKEAERYLEEHIEYGANRRCGFVKVHFIKGENRSTLLDGWKKDLLPRNIYRVNGIQPYVLHVPPNQAGNQVKRVVPEASRTTWYMKYDDDQTRRMRRQHPLLILGSDGDSLDSTTSLARFFTLTAKFRKITQDPTHIRADGQWPRPHELWPFLMQGLLGEADVKLEFCIAPRLVVYDEFHTIWGDDTKVHTILDRWADRNPKFKLLAMSATPIRPKLSDSLTAVLRHILDPNGFTIFQAHARTIESVDPTKTMQEHMQAQTQCSAVLKKVTVRRTLGRGFHGRPILKIPMMTVHRWSCKSARAQREDFQDMAEATKNAIDNLVDRETTRLRLIPANREYSPREIRSLAMHAVARDIGHFQRGPNDLNEENLTNPQNDDPAQVQAQAPYLPYNRALWINQFPNIFSLRPGILHRNPLSWLNYETIYNQVRDYTPISDYFTNSKAINLLTTQSAKIRALDTILDAAQSDTSLFSPYSNQTPAPNERPLKKHVVIFTSSPSESAILTTHLLATRSNHYNIHWIRTSHDATNLIEETDFTTSQSTLFPDIRITRVAKPTLVIGTTAVLNTSTINSLSRCAYGILFRLPWAEAEELEAMGRIYRANQRYEAKWFTLCGTDCPVETMIWDRHLRRVRSLEILLADEETPGMGAAPVNPGDAVYTNGCPPEFVEWVPS
ncbi:hypothetical protein V8F20_011983 [Naviculisporaceae sp. PSN 640]